MEMICPKAEECFNNECKAKVPHEKCWSCADACARPYPNCPACTEYIAPCETCHITYCAECPFPTNKPAPTYRLVKLPPNALELFKNILELAEHGDYSNGVTHLGTDEGKVRAWELLTNYRKEFDAVYASASEVDIEALAEKIAEVLRIRSNSIQCDLIKQAIQDYLKVIDSEEKK